MMSRSVARSAAPTATQQAILERLSDGEMHERDQWPWSSVHAMLRRGWIEQKLDGWQPVGLRTIGTVYSIRITDAGRAALAAKEGQG